MKNNFLEKGNIFQIKKGMKIYSQIPSKFVYMNRPMEITKTTTEIEVGRIYDVPGSIENEVRESTKAVKKAMDSPGISVPEKEIEKFVRMFFSEYQIQSPETYDTKHFEGKYVVIETSNSGGGYGHGPKDFYPNGWFVKAKKLLKDGNYNPKGREISFYQSGSFTCVITPSEIQSIGKLNLLIK